MKRILRVFYLDMTSSFEELPQKDNSGSLHYRNTQVSATEMFTVYKGISPKFMTKALPLSQPLNYNIRHPPDFSTRTVLKAFYGTESLGNLGPKILELVAT